MKRGLLLCVLVFFLLSMPRVPARAERMPLARGVNLGNMLDAPGEGAWGETFDGAYPKIIQEAGFDHVRLPVRWSIYAQAEPPYTIARWIFDRADHIIAACREAGLAVILDVHHYEELTAADPSAEQARFLAMWRQIAAHYADQPDDLLFELLNEPGMPPEVWKRWVPEALAAVRESNPTRRVLIGAAGWENAEGLTRMDFPANDPNLIGTIHFYQPFEFTHQGAAWAALEDTSRRVQWLGTEDERQAIRRELDAAAAWSARAGLPVYLGEFGVYKEADMASRARWTACVAREAEARGIAWGYWEFCSDFGVYDNDAGAFHQPLLEALVGETGRE